MDHRGEPTIDAPLTRRALLEAEQKANDSSFSRGNKKGKHSLRVNNFVPRATVLGVLVAATVVAPIANAKFETPPALSEGINSAAGNVDLASVQNVGPSALTILSQRNVDQATPFSMTQVVSSDERVTKEAVSRGEPRSSLLPTCDVDIVADGENGRLANKDLCALWGTGNYLRSDAAVALAGLNEMYRAEFGKDLCITDAYRTLDEQYTLKSLKGSYAATPGYSNHGWGLAVDLCSESYGGARQAKFLDTYAAGFGWENPAWARPGGSGAYEPWHWEYKAGVEEKSPY